jgi:phage anti-repressor protein
MITAKVFVKQTTSIPERFVDELFNFYNENTLPTEFVIDLDYVAKWLQVRKAVLVTTLKKSYKRDLDYTATKAPNPNKKHPSSNNYTLYKLTPDCFKLLCMMSRSRNASLVRQYFIEVESRYIKYRQLLIDGMNKEMAAMNRAVKPKNAAVLIGGYIYIIRASDVKDSVYKLGRTRNLTERLRAYQTGRDEEVELLYRYKTDDIEFVESCVKKLLKEKQLRKYREVYNVDIDIIKKLVEQCDAVQRLRTHYIRRKASQMKGGYYIVVDKDSLGEERMKQ